ncbi:MAG: S66 peptidase family protein [Balneolaceae bacterium]
MKRTTFLKLAGTGVWPGTWLAASARRQPLIKPKRLSPGDTLGLVAPAGIVFEDADFERMERVLTRFGLRVMFAENVRQRERYFSGTDKDRAEGVMAMFTNPDVDGIMAVRGGWGCARIVPYLDFDVIRANPKVYCGFSDNTTLHHAMRAFSGLQTFHGPNGNSEWTHLTRTSFRDVIMEGKAARFQSNRAVETIRTGTARGRLLGGNLTILTTTLGTPYQPELDGAILFLEDIGEPPYKIDRMLTHLHRAGVMQEIRGLIFGTCTNCNDGGGLNFTIQELLHHHTRELNIPVMYNADLGHDDDNFTIPQGALAEMDADAGTFTLTEPAVS